MTNTNATAKVTRATALERAITNCEKGGLLTPEELEVLNKMYTSLTKARPKSDTKSRTRIENEELARRMAQALAAHENEETTAKWVASHVTGIISPNKASAVAKVGAEMGIIRIIPATKGANKRTLYKAIAA